jgi:hypothetical protein
MFWKILAIAGVLAWGLALCSMGFRVGGLRIWVVMLYQTWAWLLLCVGLWYGLRGPTNGKVITRCPTR